jgi:hypothetical protein
MVKWWMFYVEQQCTQLDQSNSMFRIQEQPGGKRFALFSELNDLIA